MLTDLYAPQSTYHQKRRWTHPHTIRCLQAAMRYFGRPASVLDVGCAEGVVVEWLHTHEIPAVGLDLAVPSGVPDLMRADLRQPIDLGRTFDWVLCWEVAEHLPASAAETLCDTLVRHSAGRILFTAAGPRQAGPGHIHLQPASYWADQFLIRGKPRDVNASADLATIWRQCAPKTPWYGRNIQVFQ